MCFQYIECPRWWGPVNKKIQIIRNATDWVVIPVVIRKTDPKVPLKQCVNQVAGRVDTNGTKRVMIFMSVYDSYIDIIGGKDLNFLIGESVSGSDDKDLIIFAMNDLLHDNKVDQAMFTGIDKLGDVIEENNEDSNGNAIIGVIILVTIGIIFGICMIIAICGSICHKPEELEPIELYSIHTG